MSYFLLVDGIKNKILLVHHKKAELWLPTGAHVEIDEHPKSTVVREAAEELGIESIFLWEDPFFLTVTKTVGQTAGHTDVSLWYAIRGDSDQLLQFDREEFHEICWFSFDRFPKNKAEPHLQRFINKYQRIA